MPSVMEAELIWYPESDIVIVREVSRSDGRGAGHGDGDGANINEAIHRVGKRGRRGERGNRERREGARYQAMRCYLFQMSLAREGNGKL
jgi:hypothetical protein